MSEAFSFLFEYRYLILFVWCIFEGEVALAASGIMVHLSQMNYPLAFVVGMLGGMAGDTFWYTLGRFNKQYALKILKSHRREVALAKLQVSRYGSYIVFFQRFIYGARLIVPLLIGASRYNFKRFLLIDFCSSALWTLLYLTTAYFLGDSIVKIFNYLKGHFYFVLIFLVTAAAIVTFLLKKYARKSRA